LEFTYQSNLLFHSLNSYPLKGYELALLISPAVVDAKKNNAHTFCHYDGLNIVPGQLPNKNSGTYTMADQDLKLG